MEVTSLIRWSFFIDVPKERPMSQQTLDQMLRQAGFTEPPEYTGTQHFLSHGDSVCGWPVYQHNSISCVSDRMLSWPEHFVIWLKANFTGCPIFIHDKDGDIILQTAL
jgi:hypothetical protein